MCPRAERDLKVGIEAKAVLETSNRETVRAADRRLERQVTVGTDEILATVPPTKTDFAIIAKRMGTLHPIALKGKTIVAATTVRLHRRRDIAKIFEAEIALGRSRQIAQTTELDGEAATMLRCNK